MIREALGQLVDRQDLSAATMETVVGEILDGDVAPELVAGFAIAMRMKGETTVELVAAARALRARCDMLRPAAKVVVDNCGTGGDASGTFNVSTLASLVLAACGLTVAKHGNRAVSSLTGSADLLEALGVDVEAPREVVARSLDEVGMAFLMAPRFHRALRHAAPIRRALGVRTFFNLLGPLANPGGATRQLVGVFDAPWVEPIATVLHDLGLERGWVVHGEGGLDEVSPVGRTRVAAFDGGGIRTFWISPREFGIDPTPLEALRGGDPQRNARIALGVLEMEPDFEGARSAVVLNAAAALCAVGSEERPRDAAERARAALSSGQARAKLAALVEASRP